MWNEIEQTQTRDERDQQQDAQQEVRIHASNEDIEQRRKKKKGRRRVPLSTIVLISSDCTATFFSTSKSSFSAEESLSLSSPRSASRPSASF